MAVNETMDFWSWFVAFRDPREIIKLHPDYLKQEVMDVLLATFTLIHALRVGGRYKYLWFGVVLHGFVVEFISYNLPDVDSFWHAQGMVMFLGKRLPLYVVCLYPVFIYTASVAVSHMNIKWWAQPFAVGISVVILDVPYDILGIKHLFWTWHDTDPNIYDRHYWVPWTSYYFHASFACGFTTVFHGVHKLLAMDKSSYQHIGVFKEILCCILAGLFGFPLGVMQFIPIYHPLHDTYSIHSEVCVLMLFALYGLIIWAGDRSRPHTHQKKKPIMDEILAVVILRFTFYIYLVFTSKPESIKAVGLHEPIGPCNETTPLFTPYGQVLHKRSYLCLNDYEEDIFDFHCVKELPPEGSDWYTICGTPYPNQAEYITVICSFCAFGLLWYYQLLQCSGSLQNPKGHSGPQNTKGSQNRHSGNKQKVH